MNISVERQYSDTVIRETFMLLWLSSLYYKHPLIVILTQRAPHKTALCEECTVYCSVQCSLRFFSDTYIDSPGLPELLQVSDIVNKSQNSTVTLQWNPPLSSAKVYYSVTVTLTNNSAYAMLVVTESHIELTLQYNQEYAVMVVSTNCAGSSLPVSLNIILGKHYFIDQNRFEMYCN